MKFKMEESDYYGKPIVKIFDISKDEEDVESLKPVISFGLKKAKAILSVIEEIRKFVEKNS